MEHSYKGYVQMTACTLKEYGDEMHFRKNGDRNVVGGLGQEVPTGRDSRKGFSTR